MPQILFRNRSLYYNLEGTRDAHKTPVILLHGFGEDSSIWNNQVGFLKKDHFLLIPDLPGSGKSELLTEEDFNASRGVDDYADGILQILQQEKIKNCIIIGHSMGGYITLAIAEKNPEILKSFGLFHSSAFPDSEEKIETRLKAIEFVKSNGAETFLKTSIPGLFGETFSNEHPDEINKLIEKSKTMTPEAIIQYYQAMIHRPDRTEVLKSFNGPILFIIGENDSAIPFEQSLKQCHLPNISDVNILPGTGHMGMLEKIEKCNSILESFLKYR